METKLVTGDHWGDWYLNAERRILEYRPGVNKYRDIEEGCRYYVILREMRGRVGFEARIDHLKEKTWFVGRVRQDFQNAVIDIFRPDESFVNGRVIPLEYFEQRFSTMSKEEAKERSISDQAEFEQELEERLSQEEQQED